MSNLKQGILVCLEPKASDKEREMALIKSLEDDIEKFKEKLNGKWPPKKRIREFPEEKPVKVVLKEPKATAWYTYTNYEVTRMEFKGIPIALLVAYGSL